MELFFVILIFIGIAILVLFLYNKYCEYKERNLPDKPLDLTCMIGKKRENFIQEKNLDV